ncbi:MAG: HupE/UreJ family protein [Bacteroidota bacterium]|nr:HupE/UreJ family protein [Bacteroidota bacterium]
MDNFSIYFQIGFHHILNKGALDHILFIIALSLRYQFSDWKKVLVLITAFTIGHTTTLALVVFNVLHLSKVWIEFLIPVTILVTAFSNLFVKKFSFKSKFPLIYFFALFFGLIHGLGFSNDLKSLIAGEGHVVIKLIAANIGIEAGQLVFVTAVLFVSAIVVSLFRVARREYVLFVSAGIFALALEMALERLPFTL